MAVKPGKKVFNKLMQELDLHMSGYDWVGTGSSGEVEYSEWIDLRDKLHRALRAHKLLDKQPDFHEEYGGPG